MLPTLALKHVYNLDGWLICYTLNIKQLMS
jgi:hypothetical protein